MKARAAALLLSVLLLAAACSSARRPVPMPAPSPSPPPASKAPSSPSIVEPGPELAPPAAPLDTAVVGECQEVARLAADGHHKGAVDAFTEARAGGTACGDAVARAVAVSAGVLAQADAFVHEGLEHRVQGDRAAAFRSFEAALEIYPSYYWVQRLLELEETALDATSDTDRVAMARDVIATHEIEQARRAQTTGNVEAALSSAQRALAARPGTADIKARVVEFARLLGLQLFSAGQLVQARELWANALTLDGGNQELQDFLVEVESRLERLKGIQSDGRPR